MAEPIDNTYDIIDSRDVIARIEELETFRDDAAEEMKERLGRIAELESMETLTDEESDELGELKEKNELITNMKGEEQASSILYGEDEQRELDTLLALQDQAEGYSDWQHGESLIRGTYFRKYAEQLADDIGAIDRNANWPICHIDWDAAAQALKADYTCVDFDDEKYWIRG